MNQLDSDTRKLAEVVRGLAELSENPEPDPELLALFGVGRSRAAFTELFDFELPPYTSFFLTRGPLLGGEPTERTREFLATYVADLTTPALCDHVGFLLSVLAAALDRDALDFARAFLWEQLAPIGPLYACAARALGPPEYAPWAEHLLATLNSLAERLGVPSALPLHLRAAPDLETPDDLDGLLELCLSPALSGIVLTRRGILAAANRAEVPIRFGGRRFSFRSLLEADPREALALVRQSATEQDRWRLGSAFAPVEHWWHERRSALLARLAELEARPGSER
ncbi:hypothetical protein Afer_1019 [Acidimicrobium ferrooxidans DSM 10331]|uniref:Uncharacterized protein n=1 Tax=Acidimicrobium ferrooxidans (strain DSM 10331 / JCM 15462 / NBRC 103882 / ICP) TaxID=525909 RepID=C7LYZ9_ACIFD|nr:molecular chaperone TorD family protein [Acidimicrobium ferrooxidans]ACU53957.1 hypothetical protein Afer_1019 [Acidimicrobium ferrooxidans DSM 10331]